MKTWLLALLLVATTASAAGGGTTFVNFLHGEDLGCSTDAPVLFGGGAADLTARVQGHPQTAVHAPETNAPRWLRVFAVPEGGTTLHLEMWESDFLRSITCDLSPGPGTSLAFDASRALLLDSAGDTERSARIVARVAPADATHLEPIEPRLASSTPTSVTVAWAPGSADPLPLRVVAHVDGEARPLADGATSVTVEGRTENTPVTVRIEREGGGWHDLAPPATFRTANLPPPVPDVAVEAGLDELNVTWTATGHDLANVTLHVGAARDFTPDASNARATSSTGAGRATIPWEAGREAHVVAVARDTEGAASRSASVSATPLQRPAPPPPAAPTVVERGRVVELAWPGPAVAGVREHVLLLQRPGASSFEAVATVPVDEGTTTLAGLPRGEYLAKLKAVNANGLSTEGNATRFPVLHENAPPVPRLDVSPDAVRANTTAYATVSANDPEGTAVRLVVAWGDGVTEIAPQAGLHHKYLAPGTFTVTLVATDEDGGVAEAKESITVVPNAPPVAAFRLPDTVERGEAARADFSDATDPEGDALVFAIDWGDGTTARTAGRVATHAYEEAGTFAVTLRVEDLFGAADVASRRILVTATPDAPPVLDVRLSTTRPRAGELVEASAEGSVDPDGRVLDVTWDWGDGETSRGMHAVHVYDAGEWTLHVTAKDASGNVVSETRLIRVGGVAAAGGDGEGVSPASTPDEPSAAEPGAPRAPTRDAPGATAAAVLLAAGCALVLRRRGMR